MPVWAADKSSLDQTGEEASVLHFPETARISGGVCEPPWLRD